MKCRQCGGSGRHRVLRPEGSQEHYCYCADGDRARTRDADTGALAPTALRPLVKAGARTRAKRRPVKARPRAATTPKRKAAKRPG